MNKVITIFLLSMLGLQASAERIQNEVHYTRGTNTFKGYLAFDGSTTNQVPAVLVVHEWWGHNEYARERARQLADLGYVALAIDMYGDGAKAEHPKEAGAFAGEVMANLEEAKYRFEAALNQIKKHPKVDPEKTAAIGYCFGGGVVLNMALMGADLDAVASFHGSLPAKNPLDKTLETYPAMLVCTGADDPLVPSESVEAFKKLVEDLGTTATIEAYEGVTHSFTNPEADAFAEKFDLPLAYDEKVDKQSWETMKTFLEKAFSED